MIPDPQDTIVALSSARGPGARAVVRLSGPSALAIAAPLFTSTEPLVPGRRRRYSGHLGLQGVGGLLPADLYLWPAPRTFTGQELVELHTVSCLPLVDLLIAQLLDGGARAAQAGEFTLRAFLAGKIDLPRAEAVLGVIEAGSRTELQQALAQLAGGITQPLQRLRDDLLNLLADVEAGLDFTEEDIHFVSPEELLDRLARALDQLVALGRQLQARALGDRPFRAVLAGRPNAGKSSLFNALAPGGAALVSPEPGTTRDYLVRRLDLDGVAIDLVDTAGWQGAASPLDAQAQALGREQTAQADLLLVCVEAFTPASRQEHELLARTSPPAVAVATKCDRASPPPGWLPTSAVTATGLEALRRLLAERARSQGHTALAPSLSRCQHHVEAAREHLRQARAIVLGQEPPELLALELRAALDGLGALVGAVYSDDVLDRIFSRFCVGK